MQMIPSDAYGVRWRLIYADGATQDERMSGQSILERQPSPIELHLINIRGMALQSVMIPAGYHPIFYRQRSFVLDASGAPQLDATVFGYGREGLDSFAGKLWLWRGARVVDCPNEHLAPGILEWLISASPEACRII